MDRLLRRRGRRPGADPGPLPAHEAAGAGPHQAGRLPGHGVDPVREHHPPRPGAVVPRRRVRRAPHPGLHPLERGGHGDAGPTTAAKASADTSPPTPARPRSTRSASTTSSGASPTAASGDLVFFQGHASPGHLRPRLRRRAADRGPARPLPPGGVGGRGLPSLPPSPPPARLLGVPHRLHGARPAVRHLPGPRQPLPAPPRDRRHRAKPGLGLRRRRRARRGGVHGALAVAGREHLDNLIFVVNCNLQRLDGPVRGNGKIIQEAEATFRGAGWNVDQGRSGDRSGTSCWPATSTASCSTR